MKQVMIGIFAHPDDTAFGPSGTFALAASSGLETHTICVTCGGAGTNDQHHEDLAGVREQEERDAAGILGIASCDMLYYEDGQLSNALYLEIADKIMERIRQLSDGANDVTLVTFDPNGISGHLDHIAVSQITTYAYLKLRGELPLTLKYFCIPKHFSSEATTDWLYMPKGRSDAEIDETIDVRSVRDQKIAAIRAHETQHHDAETHLARGEALFDEHFFLYK